MTLCVIYCSRVREAKKAVRIRGAETRWRDLEEDGSKWKKGKKRRDKDAKRKVSRRERQHGRKTRRMREERDSTKVWSTEIRGRDGWTERETKREEREARAHSQR